jgi:hypothetical protein
MIPLRTLLYLGSLVLCLAGSPAGLWGAAPRSKGAVLYKQQCAKCHGKTGDGVKGKYDDALHGDWSIEKLTRYITRNMPEDDPDTCIGQDAAEVSRYINDAFYSRDARARNHPPRVELVRLTNRQYVNTVADLIRSLSDPKDPPFTEHGLRANYRTKPGKGDGGRKSFDRVDRAVKFAFAGDHPDVEKLGARMTNEISITWRGSVIADETGDHEFVVRSPNGVRLWVNDEDTALIDAGVASKEHNEHKASIRLLGGRTYPLRLEFFKAAKDKSAAVSLFWKPPHGAFEEVPARSLVPVQVTSTFVVSTHFPPDDSSVGYERGVGVSKAWDEATTQAAIEVANHVVQRLDALAGTRLTSTNRAAKVEVLCQEFVVAAFRRPLTPEQTRLYVTSHFKQTEKLDDAVKRVVLLALKSPRFLYLGLDDKHPDDYDVAARLSFDLWDSMPDRELSKQAGQSALHTRDQVVRQARRMLDDPRSRAKMRYFLHHWLQVNRIESLSKDDKLFPGFTPEIIADLRTSLNLLLDDVVWSESSDYRRLLLEDDLFVNNRLADYYGLETNATDDFAKVSLDPKQRSGVVTHPYLLAAFSYPKSTSPIHRGVFLTRNIVGRALKSPPMAVAFNDADFSPNLTMREKIAELTRPRACQGCHSVINPLGFSLEHYDAVGRFRTRDQDQPVNAVSEYLTDDGKSITLKGARDVADFAVGSADAHNAFIEQLFHSLVKQPMRAYGADVPARLRQSFAASGFNIQKLMVEIVTLASLHGFDPPTRRGS